MRNRVHRGYAPGLALLVLASCSQETEVTPPTNVAVQAFTSPFRIGCEAILGEGSGATVDSCLSYYPESVSRIEFVTDAPPDGNVEWTFEIPAGETLRVLQGCHKLSQSCTIGVSPRCDGEPRLYRVSVHTVDYETLATAVATVPRAACSGSPPPAAPPPRSDAGCVGRGRGFFCSAYTQCDGLGQCVGCVDNGPCNEDSFCYAQSCVTEFPPSAPLPPTPPPPPRPLPPRTQPPPPPSTFPQCTDKPRGTLCNFTGSEPEADQCDGNGACVDCVNNGGCDESSACDEARQACYSILTPPPPVPLPSGDAYRAFSGDFNGDGLSDLYIAPGNVPADLPNRIPNLVLQNDGRGSFNVVAPLSAQQLAQVASFAPVAVTIKYLDFNSDGIGDLYLKNVGSFVNGAIDPFVFGAPSGLPPLQVTPRSNALRQFFTDTSAFLDNRAYFNTVVQFRAGVPYELWFGGAFLSALGVTFGGVGFAENTDFMDPTRYPHPVCNAFPSPCLFQAGFGWAIYARITFPQNIYDYSGYPRTSIEAARVITDIENERASAQELLNLIAQIYLVPVGGDPDLNDIEPWDAEHPQSYWILNEALQVLLARYVSTDELVPALVEPIVELRAHRVGPFFIPAFHASVHLNVGTQSIACVAPTGDDWQSAFPSNPLGGKLTERRKFKTDCPSRTLLMGDLNLNGLSASGAWLLISSGAMRFDNTQFTYCVFPELNVFCNGYNSNSFAFGLTSAFGGFPLQTARKSPGAPPISTFRFPGSGTLVPAGAFL